MKGKVGPKSCQIYQDVLFSEHESTLVNYTIYFL
ncbi:hypothetical protein Pint_29665 [Pistacia integerrima]|uniref:Uncharacterized protein n=2 Tax=Pistacia TaxID=55512 RepID=A0ACC0ZSL4_9ROSI|nr:hypothetical protein Pint_29665 [Pistacia integerrima]KAJ0075032.1 hypothetical protein Patl1_34024 [Pistacia atlantica]